MKTPILVVLAMIAAFGPAVSDWATLAGILIVGVINAWNNRQSQQNDEKIYQKLEVVHVESNSRLTEALRRISDLETQIVLATGERAEKTEE